MSEVPLNLRVVRDGLGCALPFDGIDVPVLGTIAISTDLRVVRDGLGRALPPDGVDAPVHRHRREHAPAQKLTNWQLMEAHRQL